MPVINHIGLNSNALNFVPKSFTRQVFDLDLFPAAPVKNEIIYKNPLMRVKDIIAYFSPFHLIQIRLYNIQQNV